MTQVMTVQGPVSASALGHIAPHEHLLSDSSKQARELYAGPDARLADLGIAAAERELIVADITLDAHYWIRRHAMNYANLTLDDEDAAVDSLLDFKALGGGTLVECTSIGLHRNPEGLGRIAERADLNIIMGSGWYLHGFHPADLADAAVQDLQRQIIIDLTEGAQGTSIRSGFIGELGTSWPIHPVEQRVLQAAAGAQQTNNVAIQVHPGRHPDAPMACIKMLEAAGADLSRVSISHVDRTLVAIEQMSDLAASGCYLEFDMFGQESTYYPYGWFDMPNDAQRVKVIAQLLDAGLGEQVLISQDLGYRTLLPRWGGPGYAHILREVVPLMQRHGFTSGDVDTLTRANPARWLTGEQIT